jgi:hypothetical protein
MRRPSPPPPRYSCIGASFLHRMGICETPRKGEMFLPQQKIMAVRFFFAIVE